MKTLTRSQLIGVFALLCSAVAIGSYGLMVWYLRNATEELKRAREETMALERRTDTRDALQAMVRRTEGMRAELATYLLATPDRTRFLDLVEQELSADAGVSVTVEKLTEQDVGAPKESASDPARASTHRYVEVVLRVAGSWAGLCTYLTYLETLPYVFSLESVSLETEAEKEKADTWSGQVRARIAVQ